MRVHGGVFVTLDGPSGVGKTTLGKLVVDHLRESSYRATFTATPSEGVIGAIARQGTREFRGLAMTCLVAADRYHHASEFVVPALNDGVIVVCDRYIPSSYVLDRSEGVSREFLDSLYGEIIVPGIAVVLTGDPATCTRRSAQRGHYSRYHTSDENVHRREREHYLEAAKHLATAGYPIWRYEIGGCTAEEVAGVVVGRIRKHLETK
jgi:dTMP kinase